MNHDQVRQHNRSSAGGGPAVFSGAYRESSPGSEANPHSATPTPALGLLGSPSSREPTTLRSGAGTVRNLDSTEPGLWPLCRMNRWSSTPPSQNFQLLPAYWPVFLPMPPQPSPSYGFGTRFNQYSMPYWCETQYPSGPPYPLESIAYPHSWYPPSPVFPVDVETLDQERAGGITSSKNEKNANSSSACDAMPPRTVSAQNDLKNQGSAGYSGDTGVNTKTGDLKIRDFAFKIKSILKKYPSGVSISNFLEDYERENAESLDYIKLGYHSMESMVVENPDIFAYEKPRYNEMTIFDCTLRAPHQIADKTVIPDNDPVITNGVVNLIWDHPNGITRDEVMSLYKKAYLHEIRAEELDSAINSILCLPLVTIEGSAESVVLYPTFQRPSPPLGDSGYRKEEYFTQDDCDFQFTYKPPVVPYANIVQVVIADVISPDLMWLQLQKDAQRLKCLMSELNAYYSQNEKMNRLSDLCAVPGLAVAVMFKPTSEWHRARIESCYVDKVKVRYVDFGTTELVNRQELRKLNRQYGEHPIFAIRASMFAIAPPNGMDDWPTEACKFLYSTYRGIILEAEIRQRFTGDPNDPAIDVVLILKESNDLYNFEDVNETLVIKNLASFKSALHYRENKQEIKEAVKKVLPEPLRYLRLPAKKFPQEL